MDNIISYFNGEKLQCLLGAIFSVAFIAVSVYFLFLEKPFFKGMAYTIIPLSILLLIICIGIMVRVPGDIERVTTFLKDTPHNIQEKEIPRLEKVLTSFSIIKKGEIVLLIIGLLLTALFWQNELIRGIGVGLVLMGLCLYTFDHFAEARGTTYLRYLKSL